MVSSDEVPKVAQTVGISDVLDDRQLCLNLAEERRVLDVGGVIPGVQAVLADRQLVPPVSAFSYFVIVGFEHGGLDDLMHHRVHLMPSRPDILKVDILAIAALA